MLESCHVEDHLGKRPLELFLAFTKLTMEDWGLWQAQTNRHHPKENQSINGLGWHRPPVPGPGVRGWEAWSLFQQWDQNQLSGQHKPDIIFSTDVTF